MTGFSVRQKTTNFFKQFSSHSYKKGQVVINVGDEQKRIHFIENGHVRQYGITKDGKEFTVNLYKPGAFFPMAWIVEGYKNLYSFEAMDDVSVRIADYDAVILFLKKEPDVLLDLLQRLYRGLDGILLLLENLMSGDARKRLVTILVISAKRFGESDKGAIDIKLKLTHQDLASLTGLTRETVSREMNKLKRRNFIDYLNTSITIKDITVLEKEIR